MPLAFSSLSNGSLFVCSISDQSYCFRLNEFGLKGGIDKFDFIWRSACCAYGERKTKTVYHCQQLRAFAPLGRSNAFAPFFAAIKVPSIKHSNKSKPPLMHKSSANAFRTCPITPTLAHCWNLRWHVWYGGYLSGRSCQGAPVRKIHKTPFNTCLELFHCVPLPSSLWRCLGIIGSSTAHCSSVKSILTPKEAK
jgi:hypothetical protein